MPGRLAPPGADRSSARQPLPLQPVAAERDAFRQQIIETIHGGQSAVTDRSVDVQVVSLRRKLGDSAEMIQTIRGVGYRFGE